MPCLLRTSEQDTIVCPAEVLGHEQCEFIAMLDSRACICRTGWAYPWAVRIRLCDLMLRGLFDTLDEASYVDSKDALLQLLQTRVWPLLGISSQIHSTIYAWIHFRQFAVTGKHFLQQDSDCDACRKHQTTVEDVV